MAGTLNSAGRAAAAASQAPEGGRPSLGTPAEGDNPPLAVGANIRLWAARLRVVEADIRLWAARLGAVEADIRLWAAQLMVVGADIHLRGVLLASE